MKIQQITQKATNYISLLSAKILSTRISALIFYCQRSHKIRTKLANNWGINAQQHKQKVKWMEGNNSVHAVAALSNRRTTFVL
jgi:hypothetical protein